VLTKLDRSRRRTAKAITALGGYRQTTYQRGETFYQCETVPVTGEDYRNLQEFLDSMEDGTNFQFDNGASPTVWKSMQLEGSSYSENRRVRLGDGGFEDKFVMRWKMRESF